MQKFQRFSFLQFVGKISDFSNADVAVDQYHRFKVSSSLQEWHICNICHVPIIFMMVLDFCFSGGCTAHGKHENGCLPVFDCLVEDFAKYVASNQNSNAPLIYFSFFHPNIFTCRQLLLLYSFWP